VSQSSLLVGNTIGGLDAGRASDYRNKRDVVLSPLPWLVILIAHQSWGYTRRAAALHPRLLFPWRLWRKKANVSMVNILRSNGSFRGGCPVFHSGFLWGGYADISACLNFIGALAAIRGSHARIRCSRKPMRNASLAINTSFFHLIASDPVSTVS
jgi:hypothetical protein